jgi:hypothetical protein
MWQILFKFVFPKFDNYFLLLLFACFHVEFCTIIDSRGVLGGLASLHSHGLEALEISPVHYVTLSSSDILRLTGWLRPTHKLDFFQNKG